MGKVIRFPSVGERALRNEIVHQGVEHTPRTHSGRVLEAKVLGLRHAGERQRPRFTRSSH